MSFGVYIHIPYCLQRCTYCDFATYEQSQIMPPAEYVELVLEEMRQRLPALHGQQVDTIYFGGGTPSLISAQFIVDLIAGLEKHGLQIKADCEKTIEINPATLDHKKMEIYLNAGINRFSVGAQSFNDDLLKMVHREHNAEQTRETLHFLKDYGVNYSFDLLFALPRQNISMLKKDLDEVLRFDPPHVSPYCLTVPEGHVLSKNRPLEDHQIEMFDLINSTLLSAGYERYEISNYSKPGKASRHNSLYWDDSEYLGLGLSAHSYLHRSRAFGPWGTRFWNHSSIKSYADSIELNRDQPALQILDALSSSQFEKLERHQALTDFCHVSLRTTKGLSEVILTQRFGPEITRSVVASLEELKGRNYLQQAGPIWQLTEEGHVLSNQVFASLTYLAGELPLP